MMECTAYKLFKHLFKEERRDNPELFDNLFTEMCKSCVVPCDRLLYNIKNDRMSISEYAEELDRLYRERKEFHPYNF